VIKPGGSTRSGLLIQDSRCFKGWKGETHHPSGGWLDARVSGRKIHRQRPQRRMRTGGKPRRRDPASLRLSVLLVIVSVGRAIAQPATDPTMVKIDSGAIRGVAANGVISFRGIPYAAPPVGVLRWRVPQPAKLWQGVQSADKFGRLVCRPPTFLTPRTARRSFPSA
jgi:Carboxylesterase family